MVEQFKRSLSYVNQSYSGYVLVQKGESACKVERFHEGTRCIYEIPLSRLLDFTSGLTLSDIEEGDQLQLLMRPDGSISGCDLVFKPATATLQGPNLLVLTSDSTAELVPISILSSFIQSIPPNGNIQVFSRNGKILILKSGSNIFRLRVTLYISYIDSNKVYLSQDQDSIRYYNTISPNDLKRYNQAWTASDLEIGDRVILKIERGSTKYRLGLDITQVIDCGNRYSIRVGNYSEGFISKDELGQAMGLFQSGMRNLKALHTHGVVRALLCDRNIIRFAKPNHIAQSIPLPPIQAINQSYQSYNSIPNINPTQPSSIPSINHIGIPNIQAHPNSISFSQSTSLNPQLQRSSFSVDSSNYKVFHLEISNPALTSSNQIEAIHTLGNQFVIQESKFKDFQSVFTHSRLFINDKFGLLKAIAVGYLDHICRKSSPPQLLKDFITQLELRSGTYSLTLQSEQGRNIVIEYLKLLSNNRSYDNLEDHFKHSDFMYCFISELKNLTYNKMIEMNAGQDLIHKFVYKNEYKPKEVLKYFGNALGMLIVVNSTGAAKTKIMKVFKYSFVVNLIVKSGKVCLLYYSYHRDEDTDKDPNYGRFICIICNKLPHLAYFSILTARICQVCYKNMPGRRSKKLSTPQNPTIPGNLSESQVSSNSSFNYRMSSIDICNMCNGQTNRIDLIQLDCKHTYCKNCLYSYINDPIRSAAKNRPINCFFCSRSIPLRLVNELLQSRQLIAERRTEVSLVPCDNCPRYYTRDELINLACHKFCKDCIHIYLEGKLHRNEINFKCILGCQLEFGQEMLPAIMTRTQLMTYHQIKQNLERPHSVRCYNCRMEYRNVESYPCCMCLNFDCRAGICTECGMVTLVNDKYDSGRHDSSCRYRII